VLQWLNASEEMIIIVELREEFAESTPALLLNGFIIEIPSGKDPSKSISVQKNITLSANVLITGCLIFKNSDCPEELLRVIRIVINPVFILFAAINIVTYKIFSLIQR
jgi:hypothetical protein